MEATTECKTRITRKQMLIQMATTMFGIMGAILSDKFGYGMIGWFIGGLIMGTGALFAYKKPEERWTIVNVSIVVLAGVVATTMHYLFSLK